MNPRPALPRTARWALGLWALALTLRLAAAGSPGAVESLYARGLYPHVAAALGTLTGWAPFSVAELLVALAAVGALVRGYRARGALLRRPRRPALQRLGLLAAAAAGAGYLAFLLVWGLNYHRSPLAQLAGYGGEPPEPEAAAAELRELCTLLVDEVADLRGAVGEDAAGVMRLRAGRRDALGRAGQGYAAAAAQSPTLAAVLAPSGAPPKPALASRAMSLVGISGIYFPFTGEPHVNAELPACQLPFVACHEIAHRLGFAREDEANFLAWLACRDHPDADFRYAGALAALRHALAVLALVDPAAFAVERERLAEPVLRDLRDLEAFWSRWRGPLAELGSAVNDAYLTAQGELEGVASYGRVVDLLLAERRWRARRGD